MRIQFLDGVRAVLALWVVLGHLAKPVGFKFPVLDNPAISVDLFMLLSGYFIAATYMRLAQEHAPLTAARYFLIRRVMRIWPVYVVTLTLCWLFLSPLGDLLVQQARALSETGVSAVTRPYPEVTPLGALLHYTLLFGVVPSQATSTPLPDWSLSLEFQFYLLFPLIAIAIHKRPLILCFCAAVMAFASPKIFGNYLDPGLLSHFRQPAFLPYRLDFFLMGCLTYIAFRPERTLSDGGWRMPMLGLVICLAASGAQQTVGVFLVLCLMAMPESRVAGWLSTPVMRWLGRISFSIYLAHVPLMRIVLGLLSGNAWFLSASPSVRMIIASAILLPFVLLVSHLLHVLVEQPGIAMAHGWTDGEARADRGAPTVVSTHTASESGSPTRRLVS